MEHNGYRISVVEEDGRHVAWTERLDGMPLGAGLARATSFGTHPYETAADAIEAARHAIDCGELK